MSATAHWLLDVKVGGAVHRYAVRATAPTDGDGLAYNYRAGLSDLTLRLDGLEEEVGVEILDPTVDWAELANELDTRPAILRWWIEGTPLEQARMAVAGFVAEPEFGDPRSPGRLVISIRRGGQDQVYPPPTFVVSEETFAQDYDVEVYDDAIAGAVYPTVFGYPGSNERTDAFDISGSPDRGWIPATPALLVKYNSNAGPGDSHVLLCHGTADAAEVSGEVRLWDLEVEVSISGVTGYVSQNGTAQVATDLLDQQYTMMEFAAATDPLPVLGHEYYAAWKPTATGGGGNLRPDRTGPIRSLTDVALFALRNSGREVDAQAQEAERARLDAYAVDGYIAERMALLPWFDANIAKLFPVRRARTGNGLYYRYLNWWATEVDAVRHLDADSGRARRSSSVRTHRDQLANVFELRYALNCATGKYHARRSIAAEGGRLSYVPDIPGTKQGPFPVGIFIEGLLDDDLTIGSPRCGASIRRFGVLQAAPVESPFVWSDYQAVLILQHWAQRDAFPRRAVSYMVPTDDVRDLSAGDIVVVSDAEVGFARSVAMIVSLEVGTGATHQVDIEVLA